jgi:hypothetical protein
MLRHATGYKLANDGHDTRAGPLPWPWQPAIHGAVNGVGAGSIQSEKISPQYPLQVRFPSRASVLEKDTAEARQELYDQARAALKAELGKRDPPPSDKEVYKNSSSSTTPFTTSNGQSPPVAREQAKTVYVSIGFEVEQ